MNRVMGLSLKEQQCQQSPKNKSLSDSSGSKDVMQGIEFKPAVHQGLIIIATTDQGLTGDSWAQHYCPLLVLVAGGGGVGAGADSDIAGAGAGADSGIGTAAAAAVDDEVADEVSGLGGGVGA
jgi:hypothetical protein